jgi:hypothetical protein
MKTTLLCLLVGILSLEAEEKPMSRDEAAAELFKQAPDTGEASSAQYNAFRELIKQGPDGWETLFDIQFRIDPSGDVARRIDSFLEVSNIPQDQVERFSAAQDAEIVRRSVNESWALLYASAYVDTIHPRKLRRVTDQERLDGYFSNIGESLGEPAKALIQVAFLRVLLVEVNDFPGHRFPWSEKPEKQRAALQGLLDWWKKHRDDFKPEE